MTFISFHLDLCGAGNLDFTLLTAFNLTSPRYPAQYPLTQDCQWMVVNPTGAKVKLEFLHFDTGLDYDKLYIAPIETEIMFEYTGYFEGVYLLYSGVITPKALVVSLPKFQIAWDPTVWSLTSNTGFALHLSLNSSNGMPVV